jgi:hypothetical protein
MKIGAAALTRLGQSHTLKRPDVFQIMVSEGLHGTALIPRRRIVSCARTLPVADDAAELSYMKAEERVSGRRNKIVTFSRGSLLYQA